MKKVNKSEVNEILNTQETTIRTQANMIEILKRENKALKERIEELEK